MLLIISSQYYIHAFIHHLYEKNFHFHLFSTITISLCFLYMKKCHEKKIPTFFYTSCITKYSKLLIIWLATIRPIFKKMRNVGSSRDSTDCEFVQTEEKHLKNNNLLREALLILDKAPLHRPLINSQIETTKRNFYHPMLLLK